MKRVDDIAIIPWFAIWTRPRKTMRAILDAKPRRMVIVLALAGGFAQVLDNAAFRSVGDRLTIPEILFVSVVVGCAAGLIALYGVGALLTWTGRWFGGQAAYGHVRSAIGWSNVPVVWSLLLWMPELILFGKDMFTSSTSRLDANPALAIMFLLFVLIELILNVWTLFIFTHCLAEAQRFSSWKALANMLTAGLFIAIPVILIITVL